ncbi:MAG: sugar phosphate nucleotidyltransferase [Candidatus Thermoplasmatota archaeon]|nr:sugar phosphate nucleotidyltransferase [Candidatus Thermoplasmatota archaeon]
MGPKHAIILAGGIGSRMLPASSLVPKEIMPLIDVPAITYLINEIKETGIKEIHLVVNEQKVWIADLLNYNNKNINQLQEIRDDISSSILNPLENINLNVHIQKEQLGFANAISYALGSIEGPFLVLLGDNILMDKHAPPTENLNFTRSNASLKLVEKFNENSRPVVGLHQVSNDELSSFGVVKKDKGKVIDIIEKPTIEEAPSNSVLCGRYLFTGDFKDLLLKYPVNTYGELQSIEIQKHWMESNGGLDFVDLDDHEWYDSGRPEMWLKAQIDHALKRDDYGDDFKKWLNQKLSE